MELTIWWLDTYKDMIQMLKNSKKDTVSSKLLGKYISLSNSVLER